MTKCIFKKITHCNECPYFRFEHENISNFKEETWYACGFTDKIIISEEDYIEKRKVDGSLLDIPSWCPLENWDLYHSAINAVKDI